MRRSSDEAERATLRRIEETERRLLRCQSEESTAWQGFLAGWNNALEVRLERQRAQCAGRLDAVEKRAADESERLREAMAESQKTTETVQTRLEEEVLRASGTAFDSLRAGMQEGLEALRREIGEEVASRDSQAQLSLSAFTERVEAAETTASVTRGELEMLVQKLFSRLDIVEQVSSTLRQEFDATLGQQSSEVDALKARVETSNQNFRQALGNSEKRAAESSNIVTELRALQGHCEGRLESQARMTAEACKRLEGDLREMVSDSTERAELAAANLDSKVAGALDAVMDARVARGAKECTDEVTAMRIGLEAKLRSSEAFMERLVKEEFKTEVAPEIGSLREELSCYLTSSSADLRNVTANYDRVSSDIRRLQSTGLAHEWCIPRCLHRIRYLSMSTEAGLWLDSDPFTLGTMGNLTLRLYPRGVRGGDGQCAVEMRMAKDAIASCGLYAVPTGVDLSVGNLRARAQQRDDDDGSGVVWLAEGLGDVENHAAKGGDDLRLRVEVPQVQVVPTGSVDAAAGLNELLTAGMAESMTVPHELKTALQRRAMDPLQEVPASHELCDGNGLSAGSHLLSQETLANDDMASTVTVGSDSNGATGSGRSRTQWTVDTELRRGLFNPDARTASGNPSGGEVQQPSGAFAVQSSWSGRSFQDSLGGRSVDCTPPGRSNLASMLGSSSSARSGVGGMSPAGSPGVTSASVAARTNPFDAANPRSPFDAANPFEASFKDNVDASFKEAALMASPTPSFAKPPEALLSGSSPPATAPGVARLRGEVPTVNPI